MNTESAPLFTPAPEWSGRSDGPGAEHARWHSVINQAESAPVTLLGFASDEGVLRNGGRQGAAAGPSALRTALGSLAVHHGHALADAGTITTQADDLDGAHEALSDKVEELVRSATLPIILGGGHETAFGSHRGLFRARGATSIINLDAHFDLRHADHATSGTPFTQISQLTDDFDYTVFGISRPNNTAVLFNDADKLGVNYTLDEELLNLTPAECGALATQATASADKVHLSIDLDVLPASTAPGVSAPASLGVAYERIRALAVAIAATGKLALVDVVELNPTFDIDNRTAKAAARLIDDIVNAHLTAVNGQ
ncbi:MULTISPECIES: formimidoylglutamase [unclassified Corynebacterium]|uniref:formimidoylglutamase n=1 Tax=Corynebacterium TaxID=1716 RepID=UPI00254F5D81|nr:MULTISPECIES: formimidoylglutamase [unclassified Corynebacterium]MDK8475631.1 formimidoylglutamase [Corynebacterium sp. MSK310]MDK8491250.1 formimidoylglutamase [Corynebacterium sp. MSK175]MDK8672062.1 formimidoylglutamase [Corynebacterium sp. MSK189]MDK8735508.1 formimidoylglutamase [Corynebacterium sp. MSK306]